MLNVNKSANERISSLTSSSSSHYCYPLTKPFLNTSWTRSICAPLTKAFPESNRDLILCSIKNLQEKLKDVEKKKSNLTDNHQHQLDNNSSSSNNNNISNNNNNFSQMNVPPHELSSSTEKYYSVFNQNSNNIINSKKNSNNNNNNDYNHQYQENNFDDYSRSSALFDVSYRMRGKPYEERIAEMEKLLKSMHKLVNEQNAKQQKYESFASSFDNNNSNANNANYKATLINPCHHHHHNYCCNLSTNNHQKSIKNANENEFMPSSSSSPSPSSPSSSSPLSPSPLNSPNPQSTSNNNRQNCSIINSSQKLNNLNDNNSYLNNNNNNDSATSESNSITTTFSDSEPHHDRATNEMRRSGDNHQNQPTNRLLKNLTTTTTSPKRSISINKRATAEKINNSKMKASVDLASMSSSINNNNNNNNQIVNNNSRKQTNNRKSSSCNRSRSATDLDNYVVERSVKHAPPKNQQQHSKVNLNDIIPFVVGKSTTPSHNLGSNIQNVISLLKMNHSSKCYLKNFNNKNTNNTINTSSSKMNCAYKSLTSSSNQIVEQQTEKYRSSSRVESRQLQQHQLEQRQRSILKKQPMAKKCNDYSSTVKRSQSVPQFSMKRNNAAFDGCFEETTTKSKSINNNNNNKYRGDTFLNENHRRITNKQNGKVLNRKKVVAAEKENSSINRSLSIGGFGGGATAACYSSGRSTQSSFFAETMQVLKMFQEEYARLLLEQYEMNKKLEDCFDDLTRSDLRLQLDYLKKLITHKEKQIAKLKAFQRRKILHLNDDDTDQQSLQINSHNKIPPQPSAAAEFSNWTGNCSNNKNLDHHHIDFYDSTNHVDNFCLFKSIKDLKTKLQNS